MARASAKWPGSTGYLAALYLTHRANTPDEAYRAPGPKRIEMRILIEASTMELVKAVDKEHGPQLHRA